MRVSVPFADQVWAALVRLWPPGQNRDMSYSCGDAAPLMAGQSCLVRTCPPSSCASKVPGFAVIKKSVILGALIEFEHKLNELQYLYISHLWYLVFESCFILSLLVERCHILTMLWAWPSGRKFLYNFIFTPHSSAFA